MFAWVFFVLIAFDPIPDALRALLVVVEEDQQIFGGDLFGLIIEFAPHLGIRYLARCVARRCDLEDYDAR